MFIYIITMLVSILIAFIGEKYQISVREQYNRGKRSGPNSLSTLGISKTKLCYWICLTLAALPFVLISAIRYYVGTDYETYIIKQIPDILDGIGDYVEPGYRYLVKLVVSICNDYQWIFVITSIIIIILIFNYMFRESESICLSIYIFVMSSIFNQSLNIMRQFIAIGIFLYAIKYIIEEDWLKYFIAILIAACFHKTAWIFLVFYFYKYIRINKKIAIIFILTASVLNDSIKQIFLILCSNIGFYDYYFDINDATTKLSYPLLVLNSIVFIMAAYLTKDNKQDKRMKLYFVIQLFVMFSNVLSPIIPLAYRIIFMFMSIHCVYIPLLIKNFKWEKYIWLLKIFYILIYGLFFIYYIGIKNYAGTIPYRTIFQ